MNSKSGEKTLTEALTDYMDTHLMEVRLSIGALGLIGVGVALRGIRLATKFSSNDTIPKSFIKKNVSLRGVVRSVSTDGTLNVDHIPIVAMPWHLKQSSNERVLSVSLTAIRANISGVYWLKLNVENKMIWFKIIDRIGNDINCVVSTQKKNVIKKNLNAELVERGLAVVNPFDERLGRIHSYRRLYKALIVNQNKAKKSNRGIWYTPTKWDAFKVQMQTIINSLKRIKYII